MAGTVSSSDWFLYIVECADASLYCGITTDVQRRLSEHQQGAPKGAKYLRGKGPLKLVFCAAVGDRREALKLECRVKRLSRAKKLKLTQGAIQLSDI